MRLKPGSLEAATEIVRLMRADGRDRSVPAKEYAAIIVQKYLQTEKGRPR